MGRALITFDNSNQSNSVKDALDLTGRVSLITGGAGFLGIQFAEAIAEMGGVPVLIDLNLESLKCALDRIQKLSPNSLSYVCDITDEDQLNSIKDAILKAYGRIDVLINNAALTRYSVAEYDDSVYFASFENMNLDVWKKALDVNLTGSMLCCKVFGGWMAQKKLGSIINLGSDVGVISPDQRIYAPDEGGGYSGMSFNTPLFYSVSKAALIHMTKHLAAYWGSVGVRVNALSPAGVYRDHDPAFVTRLSRLIPMGRMGYVDEYKGAIVFLASDASSFVTGHNLIMDGGRTIW